MEFAPAAPGVTVPGVEMDPPAVPLPLSGPPALAAWPARCLRPAGAHLTLTGRQPQAEPEPGARPGTALRPISDDDSEDSESDPLSKCHHMALAIQKQNLKRPRHSLTRTRSGTGGQPELRKVPSPAAAAKRAATQPADSEKFQERMPRTRVPKRSSLDLLFCGAHARGFSAMPM